MKANGYIYMFRWHPHPENRLSIYGRDGYSGDLMGCAYLSVVWFDSWSRMAHSGVRASMLSYLGR